MPVISRVAAVQMNSQDHVEENLAMALRWIEKATQEGASWVLLPECFAYMGSEDGKRKIAEPLGEGPIQSFLAQTAAQYKIWLLGGSVPTQATAPSKSRNTSLLYDPNGHLVAVYHKIHLFRYAAERRYAEDETTEAGQDIVTFKAPLAALDFLFVMTCVFLNCTVKWPWSILLQCLRHLRPQQEKPIGKFYYGHAPLKINVLSSRLRKQVSIMAGEKLMDTP